MAKKENNSGGGKLVLQIFAIAAIAFTLFRGGIFFLKKIAKESPKEEVAGITSEFGMKVYPAGSSFISKNFQMPIDVDLYAMDSLLNDTLVFSAISGTYGKDSAGITVTKMIANKNISLVENWQQFQQFMSSYQKLEIDGDANESDDHWEAVFDVKSATRAGRVRLVTKDDSVYVVSVSSLRDAWENYEDPLALSLKHFTVMY